MHESSDVRVGDLRASTRTLIILFLAMAMFTANAFAPALATGTGEEGADDLETVRSEVLGTYNYKIGLLTEKKNATDNQDRKAVYAEGIWELTGLRDGRVATEDNIEELWALNQRAHDIYHETKTRAETVGETDAERLAKAKNKAHSTVEYKIGLLNKWGGCDTPRVRDVLAGGTAQLKGLFAKIDAAETPDTAYGLKDKAHSIYHSTVDKAEAECDGKDTRTDAEKAAEALKKARRSTLLLIDHKMAILTAASESTDNPVVKRIYAEASEAVSDLKEAARSARSVKALKEIDAQIMALYHEARDAVAELTGKSDAEDNEKDPARRIEAKLNKIARRVAHLAEVASESADTSPDTYEAVLAAKEDVYEAIEAVKDVVDSGRKLDALWEDLAHARYHFEKAFVAHKMALADGPSVVDGLHVPG